MKLHLAGVFTGNLKPLWNEYMKLHLAGGYSRAEAIKEAMKVFLAGIQGTTKSFAIADNRPYILESFFYIKKMHDWMEIMLPLFKGFILDSGAFTFFGKGDANTDWKKYTLEYCDFINRHKIDHFVELDIEVLTSMDLVHDLRKMIEDKTGKQPIPVWRPSRGLDYWHKMIEDYKYISISASGLFDSKWTRKEGAEHVLSKMVKQANSNDVKVHGLGYTKLKHLSKIPFHSIDSTSWLQGNMGGFLYQFTGNDIIKIQPENKKLLGRAAAIHNFTEWTKYGIYAEQNF